MATYTIHLPEKLDHCLEQVAKDSGESCEDILSEWLISSLNGTRAKSIDTRLEETSSYSTIHLWMIVQRGLGFPSRLDKRMVELIQKGKEGIISETEQSELEDLGVLYGKYVLLRTEALVELQERDYDIKGYFEEKHNERISASD